MFQNQIVAVRCFTDIVSRRSLPPVPLKKWRNQSYSQTHQDKYELARGLQIKYDPKRGKVYLMTGPILLHVAFKWTIPAYVRQFVVKSASKK